MRVDNRNRRIRQRAHHGTFHPRPEPGQPRDTRIHWPRFPGTSWRTRQPREGDHVARRAEDRPPEAHVPERPHLPTQQSKVSVGVDLLEQATSTSLASKNAPIAWQRAASCDPIGGTPLMFSDATVTQAISVSTRAGKSTQATCRSRRQAEGPTPDATRDQFVGLQAHGVHEGKPSRPAAFSMEAITPPRTRPARHAAPCDSASGRTRTSVPAAGREGVDTQMWLPG
jgi:hypothetical protein